MQILLTLARFPQESVSAAMRHGTPACILVGALVFQVPVLGCSAYRASNPQSASSTGTRPQAQSRDALFTPEIWAASKTFEQAHKRPLDQTVAWIPEDPAILRRTTFMGLTYPQVAAILGGDPTRFIQPPTRLRYTMAPSASCQQYYFDLFVDLDDDWRLVVTREQVTSINLCVP